MDMYDIYVLGEPSEYGAWCFQDRRPLRIPDNRLGYEVAIRAHLATHPRDFVGGRSYVLVHYPAKGHGMVFTIDEQGEFHRGVATDASNTLVTHWPPKGT